jgi:group I intron endonuclease
MKKYFGIIYKATNKINGKVYIGQTTVDLKKRRSHHENTQVYYYFHRAIKKHGKNNFIWEIIEYCNSKEEMDEMEFHYIKQHDSLNNGYNLTFGGEGSVGWCPSPETRQKISKTKKGKLIGSKNPFYDKKHSEQAKQKMSSPRPSVSGKNHYLYGKHLSQETKDKIGAASKGRNIGRKHTSSVIEKIRKAHFGKKRAPFSSETRKKMSKSHLGNKIPHNVRQKMSKNRSYSWLLTLPDGSQKVIKNLYKYCNENNLNHATMNAVSKGKRYHHKDHRCVRLYDLEIRRTKCL